MIRRSPSAAELDFLSVRTPLMDWRCGSVDSRSRDPGGKTTRRLVLGEGAASPAGWYWANSPNELAFSGQSSGGNIR